MDRSPEYDGSGLAMLSIAALVIAIGFGSGRTILCLIGAGIAFAAPLFARLYEHVYRKDRE